MLVPIEAPIYQQDLRDQVVVGGIYGHYKDPHMKYRVLAISRQSEDLSWWVYETLYENKVSKIWHRPLEMFLSNVLVDGKEVKRFRLES